MILMKTPFNDYNLKEYSHFPPLRQQATSIYIIISYSRLTKQDHLKKSAVKKIA